MEMPSKWFIKGTLMVSGIYINSSSIFRNSWIIMHLSSVYSTYENRYRSSWKTGKFYCAYVSRCFILTLGNFFFS